MNWMRRREREAIESREARNESKLVLLQLLVLLLQLTLFEGIYCRTLEPFGLPRRMLRSMALLL